MHMAHACEWATCRRGGNLLRFVVVAMVVAEEVCKSWICLEVCVVCDILKLRRDEGSKAVCGAKGPRKELLSPLFFRQEAVRARQKTVKAELKNQLRMYHQGRAPETGTWPS